MPAALEDARQQAVEDFTQSDYFNSRLLAEYKEGTRDMKAGFALTNPMVTGIDWSFVLEVSEVTAVEGEVAQGVEEGEVTGTVRVPKEMVVVDEPE